MLGHQEVTMTALSPVWLDSRSRYLRDMYRPGMVMEQWNPETRSHDRYVIDRVTAQSHSLTLRDAQGETQVVRISSGQQLVAVPAGKNAGGRRRASEGDRENSRTPRLRR
ncbi:hypothetical protein ACLBOM_35815 [Escherichia coli]